MPTPRTFSTDLPTPPHAITQLPLDSRGYPIPYAIQPDKDGNADFAAGPTPKRWARCDSEKLCFLCGQPLRRSYFFLLDTAEAVARLVNSLPKHFECCLWEMKANPFYRGCPQDARTQFKVIGQAKGYAKMSTTPPRIQPGRWDSLSFWLGNEPATREQAVEALALVEPLVRDFFNRIGGDRTSRAGSIVTANALRVLELLPEEKLIQPAR